MSRKTALSKYSPLWKEKGLVLCSFPLLFMFPSRKLHPSTVISFPIIALLTDRPSNEAAEAKLVQSSSFTSFYNIVIIFFHFSICSILALIFMIVLQTRRFQWGWILGFLFRYRRLGESRIAGWNTQLCGSRSLRSQELNACTSSLMFFWGPVKGPT